MRFARCIAVVVCVTSCTDGTTSAPAAAPSSSSAGVAAPPPARPAWAEQCERDVRAAAAVTAKELELVLERPHGRRA